jgi:putative membrane protein
MMLHLRPQFANPVFQEPFMKLTLLFSACVAMTAFAAEPAPSKADKQFVDEASGAGTCEVKLSQLALTQSNTPTVKEFAQTMVDDHTKVGQELATLASTKGLTATDTLSAKGQRTYDAMAKLSGAAFDANYMKVMVEDHKKAVKLFTDESKAKSGDADLKTFASTNMPTLTHHKEMAETLAADLKKSPSRM